MTIIALIFAGLAALLHVYIFYMESVAWTTPRVRKTFGVSEADAVITKPMALNQGFYNLFLAIVAAAGIIFTATGDAAVGAALLYAGVGSMLAAALVLIVSDASKARAAITQGIFPLVSVIALSVSLLTA